MSYDQIKNMVVAPAKRTSSAAIKVLEKLPNIPPVAGFPGQIILAMLKLPLENALKNPRPYLLGAAATGAAVAFLGGPAGLAVLLAAGAGMVVPYAVLAAVVYMLLGAITVYNQRVAVSKAVVELLHAI
jgi:hypothetical protein